MHNEAGLALKGVGASQLMALTAAESSIIPHSTTCRSGTLDLQNHSFLFRSGVSDEVSVRIFSPEPSPPDWSGEWFLSVAIMGDFAGSIEAHSENIRYATGRLVSVYTR